MLLKKELLEVVLCAFPILKKSQMKSFKYVAVAATVKLPRSGKILVVDVFDSKDKSLKLRFFSDKKKFVNYVPENSGTWNCKKASRVLGCEYDYSRVFSTPADVDLVHEAINKKISSWRYSNGILDEMDAFAEELHSEKSRKAYAKKYSMEKQHFNMFPDYPKNLQSYCEKNVFDHTYIFISKINKNQRTAVCGHCGHQFTVDRTTKHRSVGECPHCKKKAMFYGDWINGGIEEKAKICIVHKKQGRLLMRWVNVTRTYYGQTLKYWFDDYYRNLYLCPKGKPTIYAYQYKSVMSYGEDWYRQNNGVTNHESTYIYTGNLHQVFGRNYYHVDLAEELKKNKQPLAFIPLLDNLKNLPATEYLLRLGLYRLASELNPRELTGKTFSEVLGVSKQYLPLYQKYNVAQFEHEIVKASHTWVSEENFIRFRQLEISPWYAERVCELLQSMSFERFVNYFTKQIALNRWTGPNECITFYQDYISMSEGMRVDLSRKSIRFPSDVKAAHDKIKGRYVAVENEVIDMQFKQAIQKLYAGLKDFQTDKFKIVLPQSRTDFIMEGQSLNHCVGNDLYYQNHLKGERMIFFIRKIDEADKPYFTMEIDMKRLRILQLYGFHDCLAPKDVGGFANSFLKKLKPIEEIAENRRAG